jgi:hypothetical protein
VLVGAERLHETGPFLRGFPPFPIEPARRLQHAIDARRADRDDVVVEHHERQPAVAFQRKPLVVIDDRPLFPFA